ncbi:hypothetical protein TSOC_010062 [Tetrabaena socialis]|uniref:Ankyrin repeat domain-containing protein n=1 Tax=Tetrabaena socialis TaxID=47790 RepID=A0A2J7ZU93_9CHLO|nr:hypothetical protein TSOC_010062 [Tetrabaena socialis]|eukprot:PNH03845.1 hypothetical protein TSOC_010062 [Tetrabaena socialis]
MVAVEASGAARGDQLLANLPDDVRLAIFAQTDLRSAARAGVASYAFHGFFLEARAAPRVVARFLMSASDASPGNVLRRIYDPTHLLQTDEDHYQLAIELEQLGVRLVPPARQMVVQPPRWLDAAAKRGHTRVLELGLDRGSPPAHAARALCLATEHGHPAAVRMLLERGPPADIRSLLASACHAEGDAAGVVVALLESRTGAEGSHWGGLQLAGRSELVQRVLSTGVFADSPERRRPVVAWCLGQHDGPACCLQWAVGQGDEATACEALAAGVGDISALGSLLERGVAGGSVAVVGQLLEAGIVRSGAQLDAAVLKACGLADAATAAQMVALLFSAGADSGHAVLGSVDSKVAALSAAARHGGVTVLHQVLENINDWPLDTLVDAALSAAKITSWPVVECLLPFMQRQPGLSPDADLLNAAAAGGVGAVPLPALLQAAACARVSPGAKVVAVALAVRRNFAARVDALMALAGWVGLMDRFIADGPNTPMRAWLRQVLIDACAVGGGGGATDAGRVLMRHLAGVDNTSGTSAMHVVLTRLCGDGDDEASVRRVLELLGGAWQHMPQSCRMHATWTVLNRLQHRECAACLPATRIAIKGRAAPSAAKRAARSRLALFKCNTAKPTLLQPAWA